MVMREGYQPEVSLDRDNPSGRIEGIIEGNQIKVKIPNLVSLLVTGEVKEAKGNKIIIEIVNIDKINFVY